MHTLKLGNNAAQELIDSGRVEIDGTPVLTNCLLGPASEIRVDGRTVRDRLTYVYLKWHKPPGFESSLHPSVPLNISSFFTVPDLCIAGRLDKRSEGLLLLSNNGKWVENMCNPKFEKEKEYLVTLSEPPDQSFIASFKNGVTIGGYTTRPCECEFMSDHTIRVVLTEGKNRQIRRMCGALGYRVTRLIRTRIGHHRLNDLLPCQAVSFTP